MPDFAADLQTTLNGPAFGQPLATRTKSNRQGGRVRFFEAMYRAPASGTAPAIADRIIWGKLPTKARIIGHLSKLYWTTGTASCTLTLGDQFVPARHLAATAITTAGGAVPEASAITTTAVADVTINSAMVANVRSIGAFTVGALVTGTGIPTATFVTAIDYQARSVTLSNVATATNLNVTLTVSGDSYETQNDSSNVLNGYAGTLDDCTLVSVVAGAQIANNQVLVLKVAYVTD
jgi:hypothetical protein